MAMTMNRKEELEQIISKAEDELTLIREKELEQENLPFLGRCFKSYITWGITPLWEYCKITKVQGASVSGIKFSADDEGSIEILQGELPLVSFEVEISNQELNAAWEALMRRLDNYNND